jgi:hypothetical protein
LSTKRVSLDWFESTRLYRVSVELATTVWAIEPLQDAGELAMLFTDGGATGLSVSDCSRNTRQLRREVGDVAL